MHRKSTSGLVLAILLVNLLFLACNISPGRTEPTTITVPDDYPTIQEAVNNANGGDTIFVRSGIYYENVVVNKPYLSLIGEDRYSTIIDGSGYGSVIAPEHSGTNYMLVENFTIRNGTQRFMFSYDNFMDFAEEESAVSLNSGSILRNCIITDSYIGVSIVDEVNPSLVIQNNIIANNSYGAHLRWYQNVTIEGNTVESNKEVGLDILASTYPCTLRIVNNTVARNGYGLRLADIYLEYQGESLVMRHNNLTMNKWNFGIEMIEGTGSAERVDIDTTNTVNGKLVYFVRHADGMTIEPGTLQNIGFLAIADSIGTRVQNMILPENNGAGLAAFNTSELSIENITTRFNYYGIILQDVSAPALVQNVVMHNEVGLSVMTCRRCRFASNTLLNNTKGLFIRGSRYEDSTYDHDIDCSNVVDGNPIYYLRNVENLTLNPATVPQLGYLGLFKCKNITVTDLTIEHSGSGILVTYSQNVTLLNNTIINSNDGIIITNSSRCKINANSLKRTTYGFASTDYPFGLYLANVRNCTFVLNRVSNFGFGWYLLGNTNSATSNLIFEDNTIHNCTLAAMLWRIQDSVFFHNNFIDNLRRIWIPYYCPRIKWDNGYPAGGNYWSSYNGTDMCSGLYQNETGCDGIGDSPYNFTIGYPGSYIDRYPLVTPWSNMTIVDTNITRGESTYQVQIVSNATIINLRETPGSIRITLSGSTGTGGYVRIIQAVGLNSTNIKVFLNNTRVGFPSDDPPRSISCNGTHYFIYFTFTFYSSYETVLAFPFVTSDVDYNDKVDMIDVGFCCMSYGSYPGQERWNSHCDINEDNKIDMKDIGYACMHYGEHYP